MKKRSFRKKHQTRKKKGIWSNVLFCNIIFSFLVFLGLFLYFFYYPFFQVKDIDIENSEILKDVEEVLLDGSIFFIPVSKIEKIILKENLNIENITVKRVFPATLRIRTEKKLPIAIWCKTEKREECYYVDKSGIAYEEAEKAVNFIFINEKFSKGDRVIYKENLGKLFDIVQKMAKMSIGINHFVLLGDEEIKILTNDSWRIYLSFYDIEKQLDNLKTLTRERKEQIKEGDLEYIDLRYNRIFIQ